MSDINGISGGPLISIERTNTGEMRYRLFGIQKTWFPDKEIIRAEPIHRLVKLLDQVLDEVDSALDEPKNSLDNLNPDNTES